MYKTNYIIILSLVIFVFFYNCQAETPKTTIGKSYVTKATFEAKLIRIGSDERQLKEMGLVNIQDSIPEIIVDLKYSTSDNFIGIDFYGELTKAFMQAECYYKLKNAYNLLQDTLPGYTFIIYDAVRSAQAQQLMWDSVDVPQSQKFWYVADPQKGSIHNYGMALDISIVNTKGEILDMGTDFDYFGELAYPRFTEKFHDNGELSDIQYQNRLLLFKIMSDAQFYVALTEWWHYNAASLSYAKEKYSIFNSNTNND